jgi:hypothetical protein
MDQSTVSYGVCPTVGKSKAMANRRAPQRPAILIAPIRLIKDILSLSIFRRCIQFIVHFHVLLASRQEKDSPLF